jgi:hypothetical protein
LAAPPSESAFVGMVSCHITGEPLLRPELQQLRSLVCVRSLSSADLLEASILLVGIGYHGQGREERGDKDHWVVSGICWTRERMIEKRHHLMNESDSRVDRQREIWLK